MYENIKRILSSPTSIWPTSGENI